MTLGFALFVFGLALFYSALKDATVAEVLSGAIGEGSPDVPLGDKNAGSSSAKSPDAGSISKSGAIAELFYDPLGAYDNGQKIPAIGQHSDHVHVAGDPQLLRYLQTIAQRSFKLRISEPVGRDSGGHVKGSFHEPGGKEAFDASGSPKNMAAFFKWVESNVL